MRIIDVIPLTKTPLALPQILSYFFSSNLPSGAVLIIPLGRRKEIAVVIDSHEASDLKMEIKNAGYELKPITKIINQEPILTNQQIKLAMWLGQYYFCSPGIFAKMMMPKKIQNSKLKVKNDNAKSKIIKSQRLILTPTISSIQKFADEYKNAILWHSELTKKQLNETWWKIKNSEAQTIVGTRSAVFLPFTSLKKIVVEDKTNPSHRSWDMFPHYRVHEAAKKLAEIFGAKLILKSEVPSVESFYNDQEGRRQTVSEAPASREAGKGWRGWPRTNSLPAPKPAIISDMRTELKDGNFSIFSRDLQKAAKETLAQKKQAVLFINRRGLANFVLCRDCGYIAKCKNCEAPLAHHLINFQPILFCHRCGHKENPPSLCPQCKSYRIKAIGVGSQKVEMEAQKLFSQVRLARLDNDNAPGAKDQQKIIESFVKKEADILIATQIIFSWMDEIKSAQPAMIGVISADTLLHLPDFQSGERTFQIIAGLKNILVPNQQLIVQTYNPENLIIKHAATGDWQSFYQEEIETRQLLNYPPFSQIVKLTFRHRNPKKTGLEAKILAAKLKQINKKTDIEISDALPAFIVKEKGRYVWNIIIKFKAQSSKLKMSNEFLLGRNSLLQYVPSNWEIDVDPESLL